MTGIQITKCILTIESGPAPEGQPSSLEAPARPAEAPALPAAHLSATVAEHHQGADDNVEDKI